MVDLADFDDSELINTILCKNKTEDFLKEDLDDIIQSIANRYNDDYNKYNNVINELKNIKREEDKLSNFSKDSNLNLLQNKNLTNIDNLFPTNATLVIIYNKLFIYEIIKTPLCLQKRFNFAHFICNDCGETLMFMHSDPKRNIDLCLSRMPECNCYYDEKNKIYKYKPYRYMDPKKEGQILWI